MKKNIFVTFVLLILIGFASSCSKSADEIDNINSGIEGSRGDGTNFLSQDLTDSLSSFMPINKGQTPPNIEGMYRFNSLTELNLAFGNKQIRTDGDIKVNPQLFQYIYDTLTSSYEDNSDISNLNSYIYFRFSGQDNQKHTVNVAGTIGGSYQKNEVAHNVAYDTLHVQEYIQGADNKFTTYYEYAYKSTSSLKTYRLGLVISGEKIDNSIRNLRACICAVSDIDFLQMYNDLEHDLSSDDDLDSNETYQSLLQLSQKLKGLQFIETGNHVMIGDLSEAVELTSWPTEILPLPWKDDSNTKTLSSVEKRTKFKVVLKKILPLVLNKVK